MNNNYTISKTKNKIIKAIGIILIIIISYSAVSMCASAVIFRNIFSGKQTAAEYELTYNDIDPDKYPREKILFNSDKNTLCGYIYHSYSDEQGLVLLLNGINCTIDRHLPEIQYFVDNSFSVMTFDYTGTGNSEGNGMNGLSQARIDTDAAIEYIRNDPELSDIPLVIYGHSLGAYASAAVLNENSDVYAAVSIAGFDSPNENMLHTARNYVGILADIQYPFMCLHNFFLFGNLSDSSAVDAINSTDIPVMIIYGNSDDIISKDVSIFGKSDKIKNPNVTFTEITEPYRNEHNTTWLSSDSAKYIEESEHPNDKHRANKLDEEFMSSILDFYYTSING